MLYANIDMTVIMRYMYIMTYSRAEWIDGGRLSVLFS
jgi:hypothetical protein